MVVMQQQLLQHLLGVAELVLLVVTLQVLLEAVQAEMEQQIQLQVLL
jgi:hypothetical protein